MIEGAKQLRGERSNALATGDSGPHAAEVKRAALELGFDACGIARAGEADPGDRLGQWLARGYHAGMTWMAATKEVRQDVRKKLPGAQSVVVVARNYYTPAPVDDAAGESATVRGRVARYAWGRDYHQVLRKPLRRLAGRIRALAAGTACYCCIDSGPVLERTWAERAGVGWIGKNSLALRRDLGSWFVLGVIATTAELAADSPSPAYCGSCRLCLEACPTGAIVEPKVVDAGRCISYHTIENRGDIPEALRGNFGDWIFGCDVCQEVCPWNRFVKETTESSFQARPGQARISLAELAAMDDTAFRGRFAGTAIARAKHAGMWRNAGVVKMRMKDEGELGAPTSLSALGP